MTLLPSRPIDATLSVTKAARLLGVHPNTVRAWSDAGRLRYYRINPRGDRRYRLGDLQRFLAAAENGAVDHRGGSLPAPSRRGLDPAAGAAAGPAGPAGGASAGGRDDRGTAAGRARHARSGSVHSAAAEAAGERHRRDLQLLDEIARTALVGQDVDDDLARIATLVRERDDHRLVAMWEVRDDRLLARAAALPPGTSGPRLLDLPRGFGVLGRALDAATVARPGRPGGGRSGAAAVVA